MRGPWRSGLASAAAVASLVTTATAQTWTDCNPLTTTCEPNNGLGMTINVDFTKGEVNSFVASGSPSYDDEGVSFTVSQGGDAPQLASIFTIMFGRVEITMKAAHGAGIVSSLVLESDILDEIDIEWIGSHPDEIQSNYFGKGKVTDYNRGEFHDVSGTQSDWITYTIDWTEDEIVWMADGTIVRTLKHDDAADDQYPQTPMQVKFGAWAGGDPAHNAEGTVKWANGPVDYTDGPFTMKVKRVLITDYSTGKKYKYGNNSGSWESIQAIDGEINGNKDGNDRPTVTATAEGSSATSDGQVPVGGIADDGSSATATQTGWPWDGDSPTDGPIPEGWVMTSEGKLMPSNSETLRPPHFVTLMAAPLLGMFFLRRRIV